MGNKNHQARPSSQDKIWEYYQNNASEFFAGAKPRLDFIIKQISRKTVTATPCVLNIGLGSGYLEDTISQFGWEVHSLDPDERAIKRLIERGIKGYRGYIEEMPFDDATLDFVIASEVLEHLTDEQRCQGIREVARVLKRGGWFIGTVPYREDLFASLVVCPRCEEVFHRWGHKKSFDVKTIRDELSAFLEVVEVRRTAFVAFRQRPFLRKIKGLVRLLMAKCGEAIAVPSIYFSARK